MLPSQPAGQLRLVSMRAKKMKHASCRAVGKGLVRFLHLWKGKGLVRQKESGCTRKLRLTLLEQFCPLGKSHRLQQGLCREDTDLVNSLARPVHIASRGRGASAQSLCTLQKEHFAMRRSSSCSASTNPCDCGQPNSGGPRAMQNQSDG